MNYYYPSSIGLPTGTFPAGPDKPGVYGSGAGLAGPMPSSMPSYPQQNGMPPSGYGSASSSMNGFGPTAGSAGMGSAGLASHRFTGSPQSYASPSSYPPTTSFASSLASSHYSVPISMYGNPHSAASLSGHPSLASHNGAAYLAAGQSSGAPGLSGMRPGMSPATTSAAAQSLYHSSSPSMAVAQSSMYGYSGLGGPPAHQMSSGLYGYPAGAAQLTGPLSGMSSYPAQMQQVAPPYGLQRGYPGFSRQLP